MIPYAQHAVEFISTLCPNVFPLCSPMLFKYCLDLLYDSLCKYGPVVLGDSDRTVLMAMVHTGLTYNGFDDEDYPSDGGNRCVQELAEKIEAVRNITIRNMYSSSKRMF